MTMMRDVLDRFGLDEDELVRAVEAAIAALPSPGAAALNNDEMRALADGGLEFGGSTAEAGHRAHRDALADQIALLSGPDTSQVAKSQGISESRVRHKVAAGALLGLRVGRGLRFPAFQFDSGGRPLPRLAAVLAAAPQTWPPAQLAAFMTTRQPELDMGGAEPVTPATWLAAGGDVAAVTGLLEPDWA